MASKARIDTYMSQFHSVQMISTEAVMEYVNRQKILNNKLAAVRSHIKDDEIRRLFLRGLRRKCSVPSEVIRSPEVPFENALAELMIYDGKQGNGEPHPLSESSTPALNVRGQERCEICRTPIGQGVTRHVTEQCFHIPNEEKFKPHLANRRNTRNQKSKYGNKLYKGTSRTKGQYWRNSPEKRRQDTAGAISYLDFSLVTHTKNAKKQPEHGFTNGWYADSGASMHMCNNKNAYRYLNTQYPQDAAVGDCSRTKLLGEGTVVLRAMV